MNNRFTRFTEKINWRAITSDRGRTILVSVVLGLIAFFIISQQASNSRQIQTGNQILISQQQLLEQQKNTITTLTGHINDLQNHIDCVVDLFTHPNRASLVITDITSCQLDATNTSSSTPSSSATPSSQSTKTNPKTSNKNTRNNGQGGNPVKPARSLVCKVTFGLLGCK